MQRPVVLVSFLILMATVLALIVMGFRLYLREDGLTKVSSPHGDVFIPDQQTFRTNGENSRRVVTWLANRWGTPEANIYVLVQDSEPWMQVFGLLDIQSLSSSRIWVIDRGHREGQRWESQLLGQAAPHEENIYLVSEYRPRGETEKQVVALFYSTQTWAGLAVIEDIRWTDVSGRSGNILAYQSQKHLPSITIPIAGGIPQKDKAYQTPVIHD